MVEFYSPLYLASVIAKENVHPADDHAKKYGMLDSSFDFTLLKSRSHLDLPFSELQDRQHDSHFSSNSQVSGWSMFSQFNPLKEEERSLRSGGNPKSRNSSCKSPGLRLFGKSDSSNSIGLNSALSPVHIKDKKERSLSPKITNGNKLVSSFAQSPSRFKMAVKKQDTMREIRNEE